MNTHALNSWLRRRNALTCFIGFGLAVATSVGQEAGAGSAPNPPSESPSRVTIEADSLRPSERAFLNQAMTLIRQQRRLGELAIGNASNSDVRSHAQQVTADFRRLAEGLEGLVRKKGIALAHAGEAPSDAYQFLTETSGILFDRSFVRVIGDLHDTTGSLFEQAAAELKDTDLRDFAATQLPMLRGHRNRIVRLRTALN